MKRDLMTPPLKFDLEPMPAAPVLVPHTQPFPGMTPEDSARAALSMSAAFADVIAVTIKHHGRSALLSGSQVRALLPKDWLDVLGGWAHGSLSQVAAQRHGIDITHVTHEGSGGFHCEYRLKELT